jgi:hypothetical protein
MLVASGEGYMVDHPMAVKTVTVGHGHAEVIPACRL